MIEDIKKKFGNWGQKLDIIKTDSYIHEKEATRNPRTEKQNN